MDITPNNISEVSKRDKLVLPDNRYGLGERIGGAQIFKEGQADLRQLGLGDTSVVVRSGQNLQTAIDKVFSLGGGTVYLGSGTHLQTSDIIIPSNVTVSGSGIESSIIDFQSLSFGIKIIGSDSYTTGTVAVSENSQTVAGTLTVWTSAMVGRYILLAGIWYLISAVASGTSLTIAAPFADDDLTGASYVIATTNDNVRIKQLSINNSATVGITGQFINELMLQDISFQGNVIDIDIDDSSSVTWEKITSAASFVTSIQATNVHYSEISSTGIVDALSDDALQLNTCSSLVLRNVYALNAAGDGIQITSCSDILFSGVGVRVCGGHGVHLVSGNNNISIANGAYEDNAGDGIRLAATSDRCFITGNSLEGNGAYGVNIVASNCNNNLILGNNLSGNATAANNAGTGTLIRSNVGLADN